MSLNNAKITLCWRDITWVGAEFTLEQYLEELGNPSGEKLVAAIRSFKKYLKKPVVLDDSVGYSSTHPDTKDHESTHLQIAIEKLLDMEEKKKNKKKKD